MKANSLRYIKSSQMVLCLSRFSSLTIKQCLGDISGLSMGMYFIKVRQEHNVRIEKLIVY